MPAQRKTRGSALNSVIAVHFARLASWLHKFFLLTRIPFYYRRYSNKEWSYIYSPTTAEDFRSIMNSGPNPAKIAT